MCPDWCGQKCVRWSFDSGRWRNGSTASPREGIGHEKRGVFMRAMKARCWCNRWPRSAPRARSGGTGYGNRAPLPHHQDRVASATLPSGEDGGSKCKEAPNEGPRRRRGDVWMPCAREGRSPLGTGGGKPPETARGIEAVMAGTDLRARFTRARPEGRVLCFNPRVKNQKRSPISTK